MAPSASHLHRLVVKNAKLLKYVELRMLSYLANITKEQPGKALKTSYKRESQHTFAGPANSFPSLSVLAAATLFILLLLFVRARANGTALTVTLPHAFVNTPLQQPSRLDLA